MNIEDVHVADNTIQRSYCFVVYIA